MTKEEAFKAYADKYGDLWTGAQPDDPGSAPLEIMKTELNDMIADLKKDGASVPTHLTNLSLLGRILRTPSRIAWSMPVDGFEYHPISGVKIPKTKRVVEMSSCADDLFAIKMQYIELVRLLAAYAKRIASPTFTEFRSLYILLAEEHAANPMALPFSEDVLEKSLPRVDAALFGLWADSEIEKGVHHV